MYLDPGTISFPGLGIEGINPARTLPFTVFGKEIYYYGVIIALGFLLGIVYLRRRAKDFGTTFDLVIDAILFAVPTAIICARLYYVAFRWDLYRENPISILYIWEGGIAIYGGVIGAILGLLLFAKVRKQRVLPYLDLMALGLLIGQSVGRWGNFFNREAYGAEITTRFFLRMGIEETSGLVRYWHPTFLYESLWNLIGFLLIHTLSKRRKYDGQCFLQYLAWYGLGRLWIEGLRTDSLYLAGTDIRISQLLAALSFVTAVTIMLYIRLFKNPTGPKGAAIEGPDVDGTAAAGTDDDGTNDTGTDADGTDAAAGTNDADVGAHSVRPPEATTLDDAVEID